MLSTTMARRRRTSPARWLAPLALVTCAVAVYAVVHNTLADSGSTSTSSSQSAKTSAKSSGKGAKKKKHRKRVYVVKDGDTLSAIAVRTGVSLATIQRLNPGLDANTLSTGEKVKLRP
jgi:LysM repeat protein